MRKLARKISQLLALASLHTQTALAAFVPDPEECPTDTLCDDIDIKEVAIKIVDWLLGFVGVIAVIVFIYSGILYLLSGGNEEHTGKAKKAMLYAIVGIIIIFLAYTIIFALTDFLGTGLTE